MLKIQLLSLLIHYKYWILVPLGFIEGHVVSLAVGFLARQGTINPLFGGLCIALGNLIGDVVLYWVGYYKGMRFVKRFEKTFGLTPERVEKGAALFRKNKSSILLISKLTNGFGFAIGILFSAGALKIPFKKFMFWNVLGEFIWTGTLISLGYFLGSAYTSIGSSLTKVFFIITSLVIIVFIFYRVRKAFIKKIV